MEMTIYVDKHIKEFNTNLSNALWHIAINNAPRDTGNLQRNITRHANTQKRMGITYNAFNAPYLHYLEEGMGPIKKHKGFISVNTIADFMSMLVKYLKGKDIGIYSKPTVKLDWSKHGAMFYEKQLLKIMREDDPSLTANERMQLGRIYARNKRNTGQRWSSVGEKAKLDRTYKRSVNRKFSLYYTNEDLY